MELPAEMDGVGVDAGLEEVHVSGGGELGAGLGDGFEDDDGVGEVAGLAERRWRF